MDVAPAPTRPPPAIRVEGLRKRYTDTLAVDGLSFQVERGDVFGLLGPNGAGKTTTIRMILGLIQPTEGDIAVLGEAMSPELRRRIGYLPEERGLYRDVAVLDGLVYMATLKGVDRGEARRRARAGLERVDLAHVADKPLRALSRGMQQKIQFLATVIHEPELLIIDEPFSGLDPVNTRVLRDMLLDLSAQGTTIVMSAHEMHRVEELCHRVLVLQSGRSVLYGRLDEIRALFAAGSVFVEVRGELGAVPGVESVRRQGSLWELELATDAAPGEVLRSLVERDDLEVTHWEVHAPSLEEIFLIVAGGAPRSSLASTGGAPVDGAPSVADG